MMRVAEVRGECRECEGERATRMALLRCETWAGEMGRTMMRRGGSETSSSSSRSTFILTRHILGTGVAGAEGAGGFEDDGFSRLTYNTVSLSCD
jgi:hypothetical protein